MRLFFASAGRTGRGPFAAAIIVLAALFAAYERLVQGRLHAATGWLVHLILFAAAVSVLSRRLHDRGRSGWWSAPIMLAFTLAWPQPRTPLGWLAVAVVLGVAAELGLMPGQRRFNRFGAAPNGSSSSGEGLKGP